MLFQKNWQFTKLFNYHLLKVRLKSQRHDQISTHASHFQLREEGILHQLKSKWIKTREVSACQFKNRVETDLENVISLFLLWAGGILASVVIYSCEQMRANLAGLRRTKHRPPEEEGYS